MLRLGRVGAWGAMLLAPGMAAQQLSPAGSVPLSPADFEYTSIRLPESFNARLTVVSAANPDGDLVGQYVTRDESGEEVTRGFVRRSGGFETIDMPGAHRTLAHGINARGEVVGTFSDATGDHGFLYSEGRFTRFDAEGSTGTRLYAISSTGMISGSYQVGGAWRPAVWTGGEFTPLDGILSQLGADMAEGFGINSRGEVVGHFTRPGDVMAGTEHQKMYGFVYHEGSIRATLDYPGSGRMSCGFDITEQGEVAGHFEDSEAGGVSGYVWKNGAFIATLRVPGAVETYAQSVVKGTVVGTALLPTGEMEGFVAVPKSPR